MENGVISERQSKFFKTEITIAMAFKGKDICLEFLKEKSLNEEYSKVLCWNMFYRVKLKTDLDTLDKERKQKSLKYINDKVLLNYMKIALHSNDKGLTV